MNLVASTGEDSPSAEMAGQFVHLHTHSEFSLAEGLLKVKSAVDKATQRHIPSMALTDRNNLFALVKFYETGLAKGVKPILGAELRISSSGQEPVGRVVVLAQNPEGYKNLLALISYSYTEAERRGEITEHSLFDRWGVLQSGEACLRRPAAPYDAHGSQLAGVQGSSGRPRLAAPPSLYSA